MIYSGSTGWSPHRGGLEASGSQWIGAVPQVNMLALLHFLEKVTRLEGAGRRQGTSWTLLHVLLVQHPVEQCLENLAAFSAEVTMI